MSSPIDNYRNYLARNYSDMKLPAGKPYGVIKLAKGFDFGFHVRKDHVSVHFISNGTHDPEEVMGYINDNGIGDKTYGDGLEPDVSRGKRNAAVVRCEVHIPLESVEELRKPTLRKHSQQIFGELYDDFSGIAGVERPKPKEDAAETVEEVAETSESKEFKSVKIGNQEWMSASLNVDQFKNGDIIPEVKSEDDWKEAGENGQPAWCYYENDPENGEKYGKFYNWYAVNDPRGLAPEGWHVPSDDEWTELVDNLDGEKIAGGKIKETGDIYWEEPNTGATNETGFTALPGGLRSVIGKDNYISFQANFWSSTDLKEEEKADLKPWEKDKPLAWYWSLRYTSPAISREFLGQTYGVNVRCVKD